MSSCWSEITQIQNLFIKSDHTYKFTPSGTIFVRHSFMQIDLLFILQYYHYFSLYTPTMSHPHKPHKKHKQPKHHQHPHKEIKSRHKTDNTEIEYPQHLSKVNYMAAESLESSLQDHTTYKAYHEAIMENRHLFEGKIVLHLTEGINCLYSFFALQAGSKKVYCVINGQSERELQNIYMMQEIVKENNKEDQIIVLNWNNFNAEVDIIIGEPMGYCMHFDGMLDRIIQARDMFLTKKGLIFPNTLIYKCAIIHDEYYQDHKIQFWDDVYGIPMTSMKKWVSHQPLIRIVDPSLIVSKVAKLFTFNLQTVTYNEVIKIDRVFQTELLSQSKANGIVFWFEAIFDHGIQKKDIKASPWVQSTKYTQSTLYWPTVESYKGGSLRVRVQGKKYPHQGYSIITTEIDHKKYQYSFS